MSQRRAKGDAVKSGATTPPAVVPRSSSSGSSSSSSGSASEGETGGRGDSNGIPNQPPPRKSKTKHDKRAMKEQSAGGGATASTLFSGVFAKYMTLRDRDRSSAPSSTEAVNINDSTTTTVAAASPRTETQFPLSDDTPTAELLALAGAYFGWTPAEVKADTQTLMQQRLRRVFDLRSLSRDAWTQVPVLPVVRSALQGLIWEGIGSNKGKLEKKQREFAAQMVQRMAERAAASGSGGSAAQKVQAAEQKFASSPFVRQLLQQQQQQQPETTPPAPANLSTSQPSPEVLEKMQRLSNANSDKNFDADSLVQQLLHSRPTTAAAAITETTITAAPQPDGPLTFDNLTPAEMVHTLLYSSPRQVETKVITEPGGGSSSASTTAAPVAPSLGLIPGKANRIRVSNGTKVYELDRWCPHKYYDMLKAPPMKPGSSIIRCPKHDWDFDLDRGGVCVTRSSKTLHACPLTQKELQW
ncbi:hypothetical protein RI367_006545 [Sorochytrium milnesiophthora]